MEISWSLWIAEVWNPVLLPYFLEVLPLVRAGMLREVLEADAALDQLLGAATAMESRSAGSFLVRSAGVPRGERLLEKMQRRHFTEGFSPHLATILAARCAGFHYSTQMALLSYLFLELSTSAFAALPADSFFQLLCKPLESSGNEDRMAWRSAR